MVKDAFALSPISARALQPSQEDYEAISEAFMETARGRWFLGEYAKRNRNADTSMVLDAVARIEQSLASQKQQHADDKLGVALTAIKAVIDEARSAASVAVDGLALEQNLAPVRKGARIMKEISWRWREIGADGRICDLIDQQVASIEASCEQLGLVDPKIALGAAFDLIDRQLTQLVEQDDTSVETAAVREPVARAAASPSPSSAAADEVARAAAEASSSTASEAAPETMRTAGANVPTEAESEVHAPIAEAETTTAEMVTARPAEPLADDAMEAASENMELSSEVADAHDEAVLDMIAMEMAVVDPIDEDEETPTIATAAQPAELPAAEMTEAEQSAVQETVTASETIISLVEALPAMAVEEPALAIEETMAPALEPAPASSPAEPAPLQPLMGAAVEQVSMLRMQTSPESLAQAILEASPEPSLGSAVIASGIIRKPISASDPLASLRRLTQAEKVALFS